MNALLVAALCLAPMAAQARPIVWLHIPDGATQRIESADMALEAERDKVEHADHAIVDTKGERQDLKARRRDARAERGFARGDLGDARDALHKAWKSDDQQAVDHATRQYVHAQAVVEQAVNHVAWHNALLRVNKAELGVDHAKHARAAANLEFQQAILMDQHGYRFVYGPASFERQVERMDRKVDARESEVEIARSIAVDTRGEYTASSR